MAAKKIILLLIVSAYLLLSTVLPSAFAQEFTPFKAEVNSNNINIRTDATVNSEVICPVNKGTYLYVLKESYGWFKVKLPKSAPSFIKADLVSSTASNPVKVTKDRVNIRLRPDQTSPIIGKVSKDEVITVRSLEGQWCNIEPVNNSYGWINKKFVDKALNDVTTPETNINNPPETSSQQAQLIQTTDNLVTVIGIIKPQGRFFRNVTTHKLIAGENKIFLIKADKKYLDTFNQRKVKLSGILAGPSRNKYPLIEARKVEVLN